MFEREVKLYKMMLGYCRKLTDEIAEEQMAVQPVPTMNTPLWLLGHLCVSSDYAAQCFGLPRSCPPSWYRDFGPASQPRADVTPRPTKAELLAGLEANHARVSEAALAADPERLKGPNPVEFLRDYLTTVADLASHLMTTHEGIHLGQLSAWRRQMGLPPVMS